MSARLKAESLKLKDPLFHRLTFLVFFLLVIHSPLFTAFSQPLKPEQAFSFQARALKADLLEIRFRIAPGYYLYRNKFKFSIEPTQIKLGPAQFPTGQVKKDPYFGRTEIFRLNPTIKIPITSLPFKAEQIILTITFQGCSDAGLCYPPKTQKVRLKLSSLPSTLSPSRLESEDTLRNSEGESHISNLFASSNFFWIILSFFGFGLLLSLTPCVFPMIPVLSSIIIAQGNNLTKTRAFSLSLTYVLGMAITYSGFGVAAGLSGRLISAALQNPWVLTAFALIFVALALSMFGLYELQIPASIQSKATFASNRLKAGTFIGVFFMGLLSAVIIGPCVTAPLSGALLFISRTNNVWLGGSALFALSLGMGVPLLVIGLSAGVLLPKAGAWMKWVKVFFGVLLLAVAFWLIYPIISQTTPSLSFQRLTSMTQLDSYLKEARGMPVLLYVSADWCVSCKELELATFRNAQVKEKFKRLKLLKADVTQTNAETNALLQKFGLFGPPAVLFFDKKGQEIPGTRVIGVQKAEPFLIIINKAVPR